MNCHWAKFLFRYIQNSLASHHCTIAVYSPVSPFERYVAALIIQHIIIKLGAL